MSTGKTQLTYISNILIKEIAEKLLPEKLLDFDVKHAGSLDGFMSALYTLSIRTLDERTNTENAHELIAKFMKGDKSFRMCSRSYTQFANEILIYSQVIPYYSEVLSKAGVDTIKVDDWIAHVYVAKYGQIDGLSEGTEVSNECVLVIENLKPKGYTMGPRLYLNKEHMFAMVKPLSQYHAMTYVLKIQKDPHLEKLIDSIVPLPFIEKESTTNNFYDALYRVAFDRFFEYFKRCKDNLIDTDNPVDVGLESSINRLNSKYGAHPTRLLEFIRSMSADEGECKFATILHGDFNRNNVMFHYRKGEDIPTGAKLIDFQELRYGSPCIDLSFAMYMNMDRTIRDEFWIELLQYYHKNLFDTVSAVVEKNDEEILSSLETYSYDEFYKHFSKYAFYGVMICMHFLPWLCATEEECSLLSMWFERDIFSKEFYKLSLEAGGDDANRRIFDIIKHAHKLGYMDVI